MFDQKLKARIVRFLFLFTALMFVNSCSKDQDDVELPVYDAIGGDFSLPSTLGAPLTLSDYKGKVVLLNFGYTSCPDICPTVLSRIANLSTKLNQRYGMDVKQLQTIFVTIDPERDTLPILKEYLAFFNPDFIGISASNQATQTITKNYVIYVEKQPQDDTGYQFAHSDRILLLDKRGRLRALYSNLDDDEKIITDIVSLGKAKI